MSPPNGISVWDESFRLRTKQLDLKADINRLNEELRKVEAQIAVIERPAPSSVGAVQAPPPIAPQQNPTHQPQLSELQPSVRRGKESLRPNLRRIEYQESSGSGSEDSSEESSKEDEQPLFPCPSLQTYTGAPRSRITGADYVGGQHFKMLSKDHTCIIRLPQGWAQLWCPYCGTNIVHHGKSDAFFKGIRGLQTHLFGKHSIEGLSLEGIAEVCAHLLDNDEIRDVKRWKKTVTMTLSDAAQPDPRYCASDPDDDSLLPVSEGERKGANDVGAYDPHRAQEHPREMNIKKDIHSASEYDGAVHAGTEGLSVQQLGHQAGAYFGTSATKRNRGDVGHDEISDRKRLRSPHHE